VREMDLRDRTGNYFFVLLAIAAWTVVFAVVTTTYPRENPTSGLVGAGAIGLACGVTAVPLFWLAAFARHRRIAFRGDWSRAIRRGPGWQWSVRFWWRSGSRAC